MKPLQRYGLMKKLVLACGLNGLGCGGEIMNPQIQQSELVLTNQMSREEFAKILVELVKSKRELQRAIMEVVWSCPNIVREV
jgi:hypothetical protein